MEGLPYVRGAKVVKTQVPGNMVIAEEVKAAFVNDGEIDYVVLDQHRVVCVGKDMSQAVWKMLTVEHDMATKT